MTAKRKTVDPSATVMIITGDNWAAEGLVLALEGANGIRIAAISQGGHRALRCYEEHRPEIVLLDTDHACEMTGIETIEALCSLDPSASIIAITSSWPRLALARAFSAGACAAIEKMSSMSELRTAVASIAAHTQPLRLKMLVPSLTFAQEVMLDIEPPHVTTTELSVLQLLCAGLSYEEIASQLCVSVCTVETHSKHLREKLEARGIGQLIARAFEYRFVNP